MLDKELNLELEEEFTSIVDLLKDVIKKEKLKNANIICFVPHEVSSLVYIGWEDGLIEDLRDCLRDLLPENKWKHHDEPDTPFRHNFYEHIRSKLIGNTSTTLIVKDGELYLGKYQDIYFYSPVYKNIPNQKIFLRITEF